MMNPSNSIQTCMETSDWLKGIVSEEGSMVDSSPPQMLPDRRLRPPQDQALKCPRCDSTHTKFCYYNNYSLSQPRYFCKTCRRYWTKGGSLRNVPVGGGCRKNKRSGASGKKLLADINSPLHHFQTSIGSSMLSQRSGTDLHLSFSSLLPPISNLNSLSLTGPPREFDNFMDCNYNVSMFESLNHPRDNKLDAILGDPRNQIFSYTNVGDGVNEDGGRGRLCGTDCHIFSPSMSFQGMSSLGFSTNGTHATLMETCGTQRLPLPFDPIDTSNVEVKPNGKMLSLEWQDQGCGEVGRESFGCNNVVGVWGVGNGSN